MSCWKTIPWRKTPIVALLALLASGAALPAGENEKAIQAGKRTYGMYCLNCHGASGRGDGPTAEVLTIPPTDLTRIRVRNEGAFPIEEIRRIIDGRTAVRAHGMREMPLWGTTFQERGLDTNQDEAVRVKILQLIRYLQSIQVEPEAKPANTAPEK
jgi:mono/diheme cytochrome c family protein